jgi:hypothetical protein
VIARADARAEERQGDGNVMGIQLVGDVAPRSFASISFDGKQVVRVTGSTASR